MSNQNLDPETALAAALAELNAARDKIAQLEALSDLSERLPGKTPLFISRSFLRGIWSLLAGFLMWQVPARKENINGTGYRAKAE